ncbi:MAG: threonine aldolase family protein [Acidimicrobiales bacterium]
MPDGPVDLRSDTVTRPTPAMRRAMAQAEVGDDVYGEDPTVRVLEEVFADRVAKEAALFVPSGTMANQIALRLLAGPGTVVIAGRRQHVVAYENGAGARNAGVQFHPLEDDDGRLRPADVAWVVDAAAHHMPRPGLLCVENTHMPADGAPWSLEALDQVVAATAGLPVHMDGARLFNASVATGIDPGTYAGRATTVMCCLSKGLCAPVGSLLAGPSDLMAEARLLRSGLGGGMRQAGILAAAGLVALEAMVERLAEDHDRARRLAEAVSERWPDSGCRPERIVTNVVTFHHAAPRAVIDHLAAAGILVGTIAPGVVRLVTHHDVDDQGISRAVKALADAP